MGINILSDNQATAGRLLRNLTGINTYSTALVTYETNPYDWKSCVKFVTTGTLQGIWLNRTLNTLNTYSFAANIYSSVSGQLRVYIGETGDDFTSVAVVPGFNLIKFENHTPQNATYPNNIIINTYAAGTFYYVRGSLEIGPICTDSMLREIDLTRNSITSNEAVQNLKTWNLKHLNCGVQTKYPKAILQTKYPSCKVQTEVG